MTSSFSKWTNTYINECGTLYPLSVSYQTTGLLLNETLNSAISFDQDNNRFTVFTDDLTLNNINYTIVVFGNIDNYLQNFTKTFTLII